MLVAGLCRLPRLAIAVAPMHALAGLQVTDAMHRHPGACASRQHLRMGRGRSGKAQLVIIAAGQRALLPKF